MNDPDIIILDEHFNPRSPCGERPNITICDDCRTAISIHAPLAGSDPGPTRRRWCGCYFNPRSPCGERLDHVVQHNHWNGFQSTLPLRGATSFGFEIAEQDVISIHAPLAGSDHVAPWVPPPFIGFQSTLPLRGATSPFKWQQADRSRNFNPRSPCGERRGVMLETVLMYLFQSTLPLRGATLSFLHSKKALIYFNPRSPCGERPFAGEQAKGRTLFQSTLPLRGATTEDCIDIEMQLISIHAPLAGSDNKALYAWFNEGISIHAPLAGSDPTLYQQAYDQYLFQSTLPLRGATTAKQAGTEASEISIHAPLAGSDLDLSRYFKISKFNFNPRSPCGERLDGDMFFQRLEPFQSTLPLRGATSVLRKLQIRRKYFNPRSPCGERLKWYRKGEMPGEYFNPRSPCGERQMTSDVFGVTTTFQSTLPLRGATSNRVPISHISKFQSTLPLRGAT